MQIKDIVSEVQTLETVRGGRGYVSGNTISNYFEGGNASSSVSTGGVAALHSPVTIGVETVAANLVQQRGSIVDEYRTEYSVDIRSSLGVLLR